MLSTQLVFPLTGDFVFLNQRLLVFMYLFSYFYGLPDKVNENLAQQTTPAPLPSGHVIALPVRIKSPVRVHFHDRAGCSVTARNHAFIFTHFFSRVNT